jgi:hypothetical protein
LQSYDRDLRADVDLLDDHAVAHQSGINCGSVQTEKTCVRRRVEDPLDAISSSFGVVTVVSFIVSSPPA